MDLWCSVKQDFSKIWISKHLLFIYSATKRIRMQKWSLIAGRGFSAVIHLKTVCIFSVYILKVFFFNFLVYCAVYINSVDNTQWELERIRAHTRVWKEISESGFFSSLMILKFLICISHTLKILYGIPLELECIFEFILDIFFLLGFI